MFLVNSIKKMGILLLKNNNSKNDYNVKTGTTLTSIDNFNDVE